MLAEYFKKRDGALILRCEKGFLAYLVRGDQFYICDFYLDHESGVRPHNFIELFDRATERAKADGCKTFGCRLSHARLDFTEMLTLYSKYGFKIKEVDPYFIGMLKEIE